MSTYRLAWRATTKVLVVVPPLLLPAALLWSAALVQYLGLAHPLDAVAESGAPPPFGRLAFLAVVGGFPALAGLLCLLALVSLEIRLEGWDVHATLHLPRPPWRFAQLCAAALLLASALFIAGIGAHAILD